MSNNRRLSRALSLVLPAGALGASVLLALSSAEAAPSQSRATDDGTDETGVADRLQTIRSGIDDFAAEGAAGSAEIEPGGSGQLQPTWWGNGGWGRWHGGWGNGGWRWGWHNGGWGWPNGWHNWGNGGWPNGWHNWGNGPPTGWHNFWHNG
jgi:rSAM-associated Gly-rich repeat protein